ncbi:hypothetical protein O9993_15260 [Vibrio lentus]|nr:hypothetical protein [Vibrio lentus]
MPACDRRCIGSCASDLNVDLQWHATKIYRYVGAQDRTHSPVLPITPTISISTINSGNDVNESESPTLILDGTTVRFSEGDVEPCVKAEMGSQSFRC